MGATNRQQFEKYGKKGIPKSMRKKGAERVGMYNLTGSAFGSILGPAGEGFREGVGWFLLGSRVVLI